MYTAYNISGGSSLLSFRTKGSVSLSFNDYCSTLLNERFDTCNQFSPPSRCCSCYNCCSCCASSFDTRRVNVSPNLLYGLRQSTLIQFSPTRRLIFGGRDRCYYRIPDYGSCEVSCSVKGKSCSGERMGRRRKDRFRCVSSVERRCLSSFDEVDAVISLLSEEVDEEYLGGRDRYDHLSNKVKSEKRGSYGGRCNGEKKKNVGSSLPECNSKCEYESVIANTRKEVRRRKEEKEDRERKENKEEREEKVGTLKGENHRARKSSSSISSYYSLSSAEDLESDREGVDEYSSFLEESSSASGYKKEFRSGESGFEGQVGEQYKGHQYSLDKQGQVLKEGTTATRTNVDWDLRKKSEKKLSDIEEMQYREELTHKHSKMATTNENDSKNVSTSHTQIADVEGKSNLAVNWENRRKMRYSHTGNQVTEQSELRRNYKEISNIQEIHGEEVETTSQHQKRFSGRQENVTVDAELYSARRDGDLRMVAKSGGKDNSRKETQQLTERPGIEILDKEKASNLQWQSESKMKMQENDKNLSSINETNKQHYQSGEQIGRKMESRYPPQSSEMSEIHDSYSRKTSISQLESRKDSKEGSSITVSTTGVDAREQRPQSVQKLPSRIQPRKDPQGVTNISVDVTNVSVLQVSDRKTIANSQNISQTLLNQDSQPRVQQINMEHGDQRNSKVMTPPSSQLFGRDSVQVNSNSGVATEEYRREDARSDQNSGRIPASLEEPFARDRIGTHGEQIPEDALGSAHRMEDSSTHFVGEFIEKARHEVSTSDIHKKAVSDTELVYEGNKHKQKSLNQYSSEELKDHESRRSPGASEVKGPSDEMWDVTVPSVQEPSKPEAAEGSTATENTVVRSGSSLWSIIANIVRLRWGSRAETPKSAGRSGGKSTSNESVSSEAWFSGHEVDENSDENVKRENIGMAEKASSSHLPQLRQTSEEASDSFGSKDMTKQLEVGTSSPSITLKSGSSSKGISTPSEEENVGGSEFGKSSQITPSGTEAQQLPIVSFPYSTMSSPILQKSSGKGNTALPGSSFVDPIEQPVGTKLPEESGSEGKEWVLKQRKLQRTKQVSRDRFDEWEEAYIQESKQRKIDEMFMREALLEAKKAADFWEVPVGAVLVQDGKIIARGYNLVEELRDSTAHAEMICIREASNQLRTWRLAGTTLYVTLEPCPMCAGAILQARIATVVWGAPNKLLGADGSWIRLFPNGGGNGAESSDKPAAPVHPFHPKMTIRRGILASECAEVMQQFFQLRRRKKQKNEDQPPESQPSCFPVVHRQSKFLSKMHDIMHAMICL